MKLLYCSLKTPVGLLTIGEEDGALASIQFHGIDAALCPPTPLLQYAQEQLTAYFSGQRKTFALPLAPHGTPFQRAVWQALQKIPYGQTRSYGEIAALIGKPHAYRAVGAANHCNPLPILIPCHRVVGANGTLTGYAGGLTTKQFLLELEKHNA